MRKYLNKQSILAIILLTVPVSVFAADASGSGNSMNMLLIGLISLIIILLFAIGMLGSTLVQLGLAYRNKLKEERGNKSGTAVKSLLLLLAAGTVSFSAMAQDAEAVVTPVSNSIGGILKEEFYIMVGVITLELIVLIVQMALVKVLIKALTAKPGDEVVVRKKKTVPFWDRFHNAVAIEKEEDILLDHDYDGIKELDNSLPPWWKYGFYVTIVVGVIYMWYYHGGGNGMSSEEEYVASIEKAEKEVAAYLAKSANNVDENSVVMLEGMDIAKGQEMFVMTCAACHGPDGGGNTIGPNLADNYWLHGGSLKDIFKSIKYGWPDKGMVSWKEQFSPKEIAQLTSYIRSLQGTTPANPKAPQGELYIEAENKEGVGENTDSTATEVTEPEVAIVE